MPKLDELRSKMDIWGQMKNNGYLGSDEKLFFATDKDVSKYTVFFTASAALIVASAIGVLAERARDYLRTDIGA